MEEFGLVIFDCDGVLVDTKPIECEVVAQVMAGLGFHLTPEDVRRESAGTTDAEMWQKFELLYHCEIDATVRAKYWDLVTTAWRQRLQPIPGVQEVLEYLKRAGIPMCVASSGVPEQMEVTLDATGLAPYFGNAVFSTSQVARGKPAPDVFLFAAAAFSMPASRCAVVEDGIAGMVGGLAAGMTVFAYTPQLLPEIMLLDVGQFAQMKDLVGLLRAPSEKRISHP